MKQILLAGAATAAEKPNIARIFTDNQGYQDLGYFGAKSIKTPNIDKMATEGLKLTNFYRPAGFVENAKPLSQTQLDN